MDSRFRGNDCGAARPVALMMPLPAIKIENLPNFKLQATGQINLSIQTPAMSIEQKAERARPSFPLLNFSGVSSEFHADFT